MVGINHCWIIVCRWYSIWGGWGWINLGGCICWLVIWLFCWLFINIDLNLLIWTCFSFCCIIVWLCLKKLGNLCVEKWNMLIRFLKVLEIILLLIMILNTWSLLFELLLLVINFYYGEIRLDGVSVTSTKPSRITEDYLILDVFVIWTVFFSNCSWLISSGWLFLILTRQTW